MRSFTGGLIALAMVVGLGGWTGGCSGDAPPGIGSSSGNPTGGAGASSSTSSGAAPSSSGASSGGGSTSSGGPSSGGSSTSSSGSSVDAGTESNEGGVADCPIYCGAMKNSCAGVNAQYLDDTDCTAVCAVLPIGPGPSSTADDLGCREFHEALAGSNPTTHCPHAGPFGGDACGTHCDAFCRIEVAVCGSGAGKPYSDVASCMKVCAGYARGPQHVSAAGPISGDSFDCRAWHLLKAAQDSASVATQCPYTAPAGSGTFPCH